MRKLLIIFCILIPLCFEAQGQKPPKLVFENRVMDLGSIPLSKKDTTVVFHYRNESDSVLVIVNMIPTCTCVVPNYSKEPMAPGDCNSFSVRYTLSHAGAFSQAVTICFSSPNSSEMELIRVGIKGVVVEEKDILQESLE